MLRFLCMMTYVSFILAQVGGAATLAHDEGNTKRGPTSGDLRLLQIDGLDKTEGSCTILCPDGSFCAGNICQCAFGGAGPALCKQ